MIKTTRTHYGLLILRTPAAMPALLLIGAALIILASCAANVETQAAPLSLRSDSSIDKNIQVTKDTKVSSSAGYSRVIRTGSQWKYVGSITKGDVYKPANNIFTIEGAHVHEAFLVIQGGILTGFYLPVEHQTLGTLAPVFWGDASCCTVGCPRFRP